MARATADGEDDIEIVDSGHQPSTQRTEEGLEEFWAVVKKSGEEETVTVKLCLRDEEAVLDCHSRSQVIKAGKTVRYRFIVSVPPGFDQYVFVIPEREDDTAD
jgi:hypothetical protein